jgi:aryl-alcohol dehydrogenase-like predicted oxidoreductase
MAVVLREMEELTASGAVRYFGCCGYMMSELGDKPLFAKAIGAQRLVSLQSECNLLYPSALTDLTMDVNSRQIGFIPFMPLGGGALTGKYQSTSKPQAGSRLAASASAEHRYLPIAGALAWRRYRGSRQKGDVRRSNCPLAGCCLHRAFHRSSQVQVDRT